MNRSKDIKPGLVNSRLDLRADKEGIIVLFLAVLHPNIECDLP